MKIPVTLKLVVLMVGATGFYAYVGQLVPQKEVHPPEVVELDQSMTSEEMAVVGKEIFEGKGICSTCHTIGKTGALRFPDMAGIATRAATRVPGLDAVNYLAQSLYEPDVFLVEGFNPGMPAIQKPPIGLTDGEILTVIAYLQTLGGTATVTLDTVLTYTDGGDGAAVVADAGAAEDAAAPAVDSGPAVMLTEFGCTACHLVSEPGPLQGPSLYDVGSRLARAEILTNTVAHDQPVQGAEQLTLAELDTMVDYLTTLKGQG